MIEANTPCPLCSSPDTFLYLKAEKFAIRSCKNCTNAWTIPPPQHIEYEKRDFHKLQVSQKNKKTKSIEDLATAWQKSIRMQVKLVEKYLPKGSSVLEIGCGEGIFLNQLQKIGFNVSGIEPSESASATAKSKGMDVIQGYFPNEHLNGKKFDLVMISHVLEHLQNPREIIKSIREHLTNNGKILFVQTNYRGIIPRLFNSKWYAWVPDEHFWHFTPHGINILSEEIGFKEVECEFSSLVYYSKDVTSFKNTVMYFIEGIIRILPGHMKDQFHLLVSL